VGEEGKGEGTDVVTFTEGVQDNLVISAMCCLCRLDDIRDNANAQMLERHRRIWYRTP
jgi:hypothetical protein